jgi:hypothetical protein
VIRFAEPVASAAFEKRDPKSGVLRACFDTLPRTAARAGELLLFNILHDAGFLRSGKIVGRQHLLTDGSQQSPLLYRECLERDRNCATCHGHKTSARRGGASTGHCL